MGAPPRSPSGTPSSAGWNRSTHQDRGVRVVPASMHHAHRAAAELAGRGRAERHVGALRDRQRVHVGTQHDRRARHPALQHGDHAGVRHTGPHLQPERTEVLGHSGGSAGLAVRQLRVTVEIAAPLDDPRLKRGRGAVELRRRDLGACAGRGHQQAQGGQEATHRFLRMRMR